MAVQRKPHRISVIAPLLTADGADAAHEREAALVVWVACIEALQRHPRLAVLDAEATPLVVSDGHWAPDHGGRGARIDDAFHGPTRRDELVWLELDVKAGRTRLHAVARDGTRTVYDGDGRRLGEQIDVAIATWLAARGLGALARAFEPCASDELFAAVRAIAPVLAEQARGWTGVDSRRGDFERDDELPSDVTVELVPVIGTPSERIRQPVIRAVAARLASALRVPVLRVLELVLGEPLPELILAVDAEHPQALLAARRETPDLATIRRALASAPGWWKPYQLLCRERAADAFAAAGMAVLVRPDTIEVASRVAPALADAGHADDALRAIERIARCSTDDARVVMAALDTYQRSGRLGAWLAAARRAMRRYGCAPAPAPRDDDQVRVDLRASLALLHAGLFAEATALRRDRLAGREDAWPAQARTLARWHEDARVATWCRARVAAVRGDHAEALVAYAGAPPSDDNDVATLLDALVAVGREADAPLAWAVHGLAADREGPATRLAAVRALLAGGDWRRGLELLWRMELAHPGCDQAAVARCGVLLSATPIEVIETALGERIAIGAHALARRLARTAADFVPAAAKSGLVARALGTNTTIVFDRGWLAGFAPAFSGRDAIELLFDELAGLRDGAPAGFDIADERQRGDTLVARWLDVVLAAADDGDRGARALAGAYLAAQALARYLAATTAPPTPLAGALRTVAAEALAFVHGHRDVLVDSDARAVLRALDAVLRRVDRWVGAAWLSAVEQALGVDERSNGDLVGFARDLPVVAARVLGPEETAVLAWSVTTLHRERPAGWPARLAAQAIRLAWHSAHAGVDEGADAIAAQLAARELEVDDAVDALHVACFLADGRSAGPCVHAARILLAAGRAPAALVVLSGGLRAADPSARDRALTSLADSWRAAVDVPLEPPRLLAAASEALDGNDLARAEKFARFAVAVRPTDPEAHRVLGLTMARQGRPVDALHHLTRAARDDAQRLVADTLARAGHADQVAAVLGYAAGTRELEPAREGSWRARRFAVQAACRRPQALAIAAATLADTTGAMDREALLARALALEIREQAYFARDPRPHPSAAAPLSLRRPEAGSAASDREVVAGEKISRITDYAALLRELAALSPREALAEFGLDGSDYLALARAWATAMQADPTIAPAIAAALARPSSP